MVLRQLEVALVKAGIEDEYGEFIVENFGSSANGLWTDHSDIDLTVNFLGKSEVF